MTKSKKRLSFDGSSPDEEVRRLKLVLGQCKSTFTRNEAFFRLNTQFSAEDLIVRKRLIDQCHDKFQVTLLDLRISEGDDWGEDQEQEFEERYAALSAIIERHSRGSQPIDDIQQPPSSCGGGSRAKLPPLDIPIFDGTDIGQYKPFMELFEALVHRDKGLTDIQRMCFLKGHLKGEPLHTIDNLPIVGESYKSALALLKKRYDNPALLIQNHIDILLDLPDIQKGTCSQQIRDLVVKARQQISALTNLNQPIQQWNSILSCILVRKFDPLTTTLFNAGRDLTVIPSTEFVLEFLEKRAAELECSNKKNYKERASGKHNLKNVALLSSSDGDDAQAQVSKAAISKCTLCSQQHKLFKCPQFSAMTPKKRLEYVTQNNLCQICLSFHTKKCRYNFKCSLCKAKHNALIHIPDDKQNTNPQESTKTNISTSIQEQDTTPEVNMHLQQPSHTSVLLPTAKVLVTGADNNKYVVRALLDCGSQISFCTTALYERLGLPGFDLNKNIHALGGISNKTTKGINLTIQSMVQNYSLNVTCSIIDKITTNIPQRHIDISKFSVPKNIALADGDFYISGEISLLLAADVFFRIIQDGKVEGGPEDPVLLNTRLGYVVSGDIPSNCNTAISMHALTSTPCDNLDNCIKQFWETEKVPEHFTESLPEHEYTEKVFQDSVTLQDNKFEVKLPLKVSLQDIDPSNSYAIALQRFYNLEKKFKKDPEYFKLYQQFIQEYIELGHAKVINLENCAPSEQPLFFLPHHAVLRPDKQTNKLRVVFDGSAKTKAGHSLNDILCNGPVVQKSLFDILLTFRTFKYTLQCDIRHMYRMIFIHPDHQALQNILWRVNGKIQCLQLQTVTYGLTSSAFLATRCLLELAHRYKVEFPMASEAIINSSYIDDVQGGSQTIQGCTQLKNELIAIMNLANFQLHKWASNEPSILDDLPKDKLNMSQREFNKENSVIKTLGLNYVPREDVFKVSGNVVATSKCPTKRNVLSSISRLFDPKGLAGPIIMQGKLIMQQIWMHDLEWDAPLPDKLSSMWECFYKDLVEMPDICVPRYLPFADADEKQLIGYCDASNAAYGCCIYAKVKLNGKYQTYLLCSKSRVAPIHSKLTIPKLELNGALLLAKLMFHVSTLLHIHNLNLFCDSKIVLDWLASSPMKLPAYIGNRVKEITRLTNNMHWFHTPGIYNPADILSRGSDPRSLSTNKLWLHGPDYLTETNNYSFHTREIEIPLLFPDETNASTHVIADKDTLMPFFVKHSNLFVMIRIMAYMLRFIKKCKRQCAINGNLTVAEVREALSQIIKGVQYHYFNNELQCIKNNEVLKSNLKSLHPFVDGKGLLRVGGRLHNSDLDFCKKFPLILPKSCHVTRLIISNEHFMLLHAGLKLLLSSLCQRYYIVNSVREIKSVIHKCITCSRHKANTAQQLMGSLPKHRVSPLTRPFEIVGLDYCGPFDIKQSTKRNSLISKGYVVVLVCFASKAVHLEVVSDMSTDAFLAALKRFVARRGIPSDIYCDNASTFKGANNKLNDLYTLHNTKEFQELVSGYALQKSINFHFIPKYSPNHGGLWEAAVKSAKFHLKRIISIRIFTYEQFNTILCEIESILNSRPLTPLSQDNSDFTILTPGHFLVGSPLTAIPQHDFTDVPSNRLRYWRCSEQVRQHFWKAWSNEYLVTLNKRTKWYKEMPNLKEGMVVLLKNINTPPLHWPMGRIIKVYTGNDNKVRVVDVQTADRKVHSRAISKLVVLPIDTE